MLEVISWLRKSVFFRIGNLLMNAYFERRFQFSHSDLNVVQYLDILRPMPEVL